MTNHHKQRLHRGLTMSCLLLLLCCVNVVSSCNNYHLRTTTAQKGIWCSSQVEEMPTRRKVELLKMDGVIGIYKKDEMKGHVCYWKQVDSGLVDLANLTGGIFLSSGKSTRIIRHGFHETCHSVTFIVLVNSHQR